MAVPLVEPQFGDAASWLLTSIIPGKTIKYRPEDFATYFSVDGIEFGWLHNNTLNSMATSGIFIDLQKKILEDAFDPDDYVGKYGERFELLQQAFSTFDIIVYRNKNYSRAIIKFVDRFLRQERWMYLEIRKDRMIYGRQSFKMDEKREYWGKNLIAMVDGIDSLIKEEINSDVDINFNEREHKKTILPINVKFSESPKEPSLVSANVVEVPHKPYGEYQHQHYLFENHLSDIDVTLFSHSKIVSKSDSKVVVDVLRIGKETTYKRYELLRRAEGIDIHEVSVEVPEQLKFIRNGSDAEQNPTNAPVHNFFRDNPPVYQGVDVWVTKLGIIWTKLSDQWTPLYNELQLRSVAHINPIALQEYEIWKNISRQ